MAVRRGSRGRPRRGPDPFARAEPAGSRRRAAARSTISRSSAAGCSASGAKRSSLAFDGDTGAVDWSFSPRGTPINPKLWIGPERVVLQVHKPGQLLVLDTDSGAQVARTPLADGEALERPPVPIDEDHVLLGHGPPDGHDVRPEPRAVHLGLPREPEMPVFGPPRVIGDAERLLVLHDGKS